MVSEYLAFTPWRYLRRASQDHLFFNVISRSSYLIILIHLDRLDTKRQPNQRWGGITQWSSEITKNRQVEGSPSRQGRVQTCAKHTFRDRDHKHSTATSQSDLLPSATVQKPWSESIWSHGGPSVPAPGRTRLDISAQLRRRSSATGRHTRSPPERKPGLPRITHCWLPASMKCVQLETRWNRYSVSLA